MTLFKSLSGLAVSLCAGLALVSAPVLAQSKEPPPDRVIETPFGDKEMNAAYAKAQDTLPEFLAVVDDPPEGVTDITFKYPLEGWEHIWVGNVRRYGNTLHGQLVNVPEAEGYEIGQRVVVPLGDVSDWGYRGADGVMRGHFTTRVLLKKVPPADAKALRDWLGWTE